MRNNNHDPQRMDLLQQKYVSVVASAHNPDDAFYMAEYLFFLDLFLFEYPMARVLGKAVKEAWVYQGRAHQQDRKGVNDASFQRMVWFSRLHRWYVGANPDCRDKVLLPPHHVQRAAELPNKSGSFDWDTQGDANLSSLLEQAASHCSNCGNTVGDDDDELKRCSACQKAFYCDRECQLKHWKTSHKPLCKAWR